MRTELRIFRGAARGATAFQIASVALAAIALSQVVDAYVMHDLLRGSQFPAARLIAATTLGGALLSIPALRMTCRELLDASPSKGRILELCAITCLLAVLAFSTLEAQPGSPALASGPAARGEMVAMILVSVIEDIVLLGLLYPGWTLQWGWERSIVATSAIAAIAHPDTVVQFMTILLLACLLRRTGSLLACVAVHALAAVVSIEFAGRLLLPARRIAADIDSWSVHVACLLAVGIATIAYLRLARHDAMDFVGSYEAFPQR